MGLMDNSDKSVLEIPIKIQEKKERPLTKVIIRRLPPTISQETFLNQVSPVPDYDHIYTVSGDSSLGEHSFARVYISFVNPEDVFTFKEKFDNYVFVDARGHEYPAVVEFAAFQRIPKKRNKQKTDPKCGTIESDPVYLEFLEILKQQPQLEEKPEYSLQLTNSETKTEITTPLLEYIKQRRVERQRIKEERREERKRKEFERRKMRDDDRRKHFADKSPIKGVVTKPVAVKRDTEGEEVEDVKGEAAEKTVVYSSGFKNKEKKFEERRGFTLKPKYPTKPEKKEYFEKKNEYKNTRRNEYRSSKHQDEVKKDDTKFVKKVKKYSERREERKHVTKINENKTETDTALKEVNEEAVQVEVSLPSTATESSLNETEEQSLKDPNSPETNKSRGDPRLQRRIKNKDRPTMAIYQPGMLSKRKQTDSVTSEGSKIKEN